MAEIVEEFPEPMTDDDYQPEEVVEEVPVEPEADPVEAEPTLDGYTYELKHRPYNSLKDLTEAGGCPPDQHIWQNSYVFGVERCKDCRALRRRRK